MLSSHTRRAIWWSIFSQPTLPSLVVQSLVHLQRANAAKPGGPIGGPFLAGHSGGPTLLSLVVQLVVHLLWTIGGPFFSLVVHSSEDNTGVLKHSYLGGPTQSCWRSIHQKVPLVCHLRGPSQVHWRVIQQEE